MKGFFYILIFLLSVFMFWASNYELEQVIRINGTVEPSNKVKVIQSLYSGKINKVYKEVGDKVKEGDLLFDLYDEEDKINYSRAIEKRDLIKREIDLITPFVNDKTEPEMTLIRALRDLNHAKQEIDLSDLKIKNSKVYSDTKGVVTYVEAVAKGNIVKSGERLMDVSPIDDFFIIKGEVLPQDISKVKLTQKTEISFTTYDYSIYGSIKGEVVKIAGNITKEKDKEYYELWVKVLTSEFSNSDRQVALIPGMKAEVSLKGTSKTVLEYLINPIKKVSTRALTEWSN